MAKYTGKGGLVRVGGVALGNLQQWSIEVNVDPIPAKTLADQWATFSAAPGDHPMDFRGAARCFYDEDDAAQAAASPGAYIAVDFRPRGTGSGLPTLSGNAIVTGASPSSEVDQYIMVEFTFLGDGILTIAQQA
jgi:hypothetical protein